MRAVIFVSVPLGAAGAHEQIRRGDREAQHPQIQGRRLGLRRVAVALHVENREVDGGRIRRLAAGGLDAARATAAGPEDGGRDAHERALHHSHEAAV